MIRCKYERGVEAAGIIIDDKLAIEISGTSLLEFKTILDRALNCADPQKYSDWIALSDRLNTKLQS